MFHLFEIATQIGNIALLALVLHEASNLARAVIYAVTWPDVVLVTRPGSTTEFQGAKTCRLTTGDRIHMALGRAMHRSLLTHEVRAATYRQKARWHSMPAFTFGSLVAALLAATLGYDAAQAGALGMFAATALFASTQARNAYDGYAKFEQEDKAAWAYAQKVTTA